MAVAVDVLTRDEEALGRVGVVRSRRGRVRAHPARREDSGDQRGVVVAGGGVDAQDRLAHVEEVRRRAGDEDHRAGHELACPLDPGGAAERRDQPAAQVPERAAPDLAVVVRLGRAGDLAEVAVGVAALVGATQAGAERIGGADRAVHRLRAEAVGLVRAEAHVDRVRVGQQALRVEQVERVPVAPALREGVALRAGDGGEATAVAADQPVGEAVRVLVVEDRGIVGAVDVAHLRAGAERQVGEQGELQAAGRAIGQRGHARVVGVVGVREAVRCAVGTAAHRIGVVLGVGAVVDLHVDGVVVVRRVQPGLLEVAARVGEGDRRVVLQVVVEVVDEPERLRRGLGQVDLPAEVVLPVVPGALGRRAEHLRHQPGGHAEAAGGLVPGGGRGAGARGRRDVVGGRRRGAGQPATAVGEQRVARVAVDERVVALEPVVGAAQPRVWAGRGKRLADLAAARRRAGVVAMHEAAGAAHEVAAGDDGAAGGVDGGTEDVLGVREGEHAPGESRAVALRQQTERRLVSAREGGLPLGPGLLGGAAQRAREAGAVEHAANGRGRVHGRGGSRHDGIGLRRAGHGHQPAVVGDGAGQAAGEHRQAPHALLEAHVTQAAPAVGVGHVQRAEVVAVEVVGARVAAHEAEHQLAGAAGGGRGQQPAGPGDEAGRVRGGHALVEVALGDRASRAAGIAAGADRKAARGDGEQAGDDAGSEGQSPARVHQHPRVFSATEITRLSAGAMLPGA